jgi:hypothetical protein
MEDERRLDSVGWVFFGVVWLLSVAPVIYLVFENTRDSTPVGTRVATGMFLAGFVAAFISWIANSILGALAGRREAAEEATGSGKKPKNQE